MLSPLDPQREDAWNRALHAASTARIFERRANHLKRKLRSLSFAGLAVPLVIGSVVLSYGAGYELLPLFIAIASVIAILQAAVSLWSLSASWVESYDASIQSVISNRSFAQSYEDLARDQAVNAPDFAAQFNSFRIADEAQRAADYRQNVTESEKRFGMRAALIRYRRPCATCHVEPTSMRPTECGVCGDFSRWTFRPI
jgi:mobilome CxxCx(11)CxxC protein